MWNRRVQPIGDLALDSAGCSRAKLPEDVSSEELSRLILSHPWTQLWITDHVQRPLPIHDFSESQSSSFLHYLCLCFPKIRDMW
ncbi:unnamed protein product [Nezara viridula]|uniref:Uncharacterized protein n=1 Tax=Nezara viridula TaxID=85310 RepID=A0A9P0HKH4_NEZVI|nr:unnamed protein product [Nezara viridula]